MWLNNDDDSGAVQEDSVKDAPGEGSPDSGNGVVDGLSDLVDFFPVHLDFGEALGTILGIPGVDSSKVEVNLFCDGAALGCVETAEGARAWNAEMFKRLWQSGSNAKLQDESDKELNEQPPSRHDDGDGSKESPPYSSMADGAIGGKLPHSIRGCGCLTALGGCGQALDRSLKM